MLPGKPTKDKPRWPLAHITMMTAHPNGQWCKSVNGKVRYFGVWSDPDLAIKRWEAFRRGVPVAIRDSHPLLTVRQLCNLFWTHKHGQARAGEIGVKMLNDYDRAIKFALEGLGADKPVADLHPSDFSRLRSELALRLGTHDLANQVRRIKSVFKHAYGHRLIDRPVLYGDAFNAPTVSQLRRATAASVKLFTPDQFAELIQAADGPLRGFIYLGLNCAFGQMDIAELTPVAIDTRHRLIDFPRPKTGVPRRCPLWPETIQAIKPHLRPDGGRAFLTVFGNAWVRFKEKRKPDGTIEGAVRIDSIKTEFDKLRVVDKRPTCPPFYALRHTFRTIADETGDQHAIARIMGHELAGLASVYVRHISDERLRLVVNHVRKRMRVSTAQSRRLKPAEARRATA